MASSFTLQFYDQGVIPLYPEEALAMDVALAPTQVLARGTVLGELIGANEVQLLTINSGSGGTFTLTFGGQTTTALPYNETAANVQAALRLLSSIGGTNVTVTGSNGGPYTVTFRDLLGFKDVALLTAGVGSLTAGVNDVQTATITGAPIGGTFTLTFSGQTTSALAFNETAANVQAALRLLSTISGANVTATGSNGGPYTITFIGTLAKAPQAVITANAAGLTGGTSPGVTIVHTTPGLLPLAVTVSTAGSAGTRGTYKAYASGNTDGSQFAKLILQFDCAVDGSGNITLGGQTGGGDHLQTQLAAPAFYKGDFATGDLTGLDSGAVTSLGRLTEGTTTAGILRMP